MPYPVLVVIHLLCAILFIGVVFFEVVLLEGIRRGVPASTMAAVEQALIARARKIMPWVVGTLFLSGGLMALTHWPSLREPLASSFGTLLTVKIALAVSVLAHFINAMLAATDGCMSSKRFEWTHLSVAVHMLFIVILAKSMFFWTW